MKNAALNKFLTKLNLDRSRHKPRFSKGDIIINIFNNLRIVSEIVDIELFPETETLNKLSEMEILGFVDTNPGKYILQDLVNEHKTNPANLKYTRQRDIQKIDAKYNKVDPNVARVLYGKMVTGREK